jgi:hypothetical protein
MKKPTGTRELRHATAQRLFLQQFAQSGNITRACQMAGINRMTAHRWLERDAAFSVAFHEAELAAVEYLEGVAFDRATSGDSPSDRLLEFLLRARAPHKYARPEKLAVDNEVTVTVRYADMGPAPPPRHNGYTLPNGQ